MGKNILFIEPDKAFAKLIVPVLEGRGHKVVQTATGKEATASIQDECPDLIIFAGPPSDIDGIAWIQNLRQTGAKTPIVFIHPSQQELLANKEKLDRDLSVSLSVAKPVIPFVFGAQVENQFADGKDTATAKLKDFETMFLALVTKYARVLPTKLGDLSAAIERAKANPGDISLLAEVRAQAHKVKGTGGSLGFRQVSDCMAFIENASATMHTLSEGEQKLLWSEVDRKLVDAKVLGEKEAEEVANVVTAKEEELAQEPTAAMARILVVDSDEGFLDIVESLGRQRLVEIVRATSFKDALDKACVLPLDAALINVIPDNPEGGFDLARELRNLPGYETLPLAFISGHALVKDRVEASYAGASLYLDKPLESESLEKAVQHLVSIRTGGRPRVLLVDDDEFFANTIALVLRNEGMIVRILTDPHKILDVMQDFPPEMLLLDVMMPGITGFEVCRMLRQIPRWQDLPIVFLTGQTGVDARVEAFRSGGDDYLPKPVVNEELLTRVKVRLDRARLLKDRSDKDTITGLLLRRAFSEQLAQVLSEAQRTKNVFTICLMDVDHFKKVNDTYGHLAGDRVLSGLGQLLSRRFRVEDLRGRWGGEEFILAFRREMKQTMHAAVTRVLNEFRTMVFYGDDEQEFTVSFSGGLASYPEDGESVYELLQTADLRLYEAKRQGRNRIVLSHSEDKERNLAKAAE